MSERGRQAAAAFGAFLVLALIATWPLATRITNAVIGTSLAPGEATPPLNIWAMAVVARNLLQQPLQLFDGNAFYPYRHTLAFSEHLFVPALGTAPLAALSGNWVLAYNLWMLGTLAGAGLGMFLLCRELTGDALAGFGGGVLYAFHTWNQNELVRSQITANQWFPFVMLAMIRYFRAPSWRRALAVGGFYLLQSLSCMYWALYLPFLAALLVGYLWWRARLPAGQLVPLGAALAAGLAVTALFALPYLETAREMGFARPLPVSVPFDRYFDVLANNLFYARWLGTANPNQNAAHFLGFAALLLALVGAWPPPAGRDPAWNGLLLPLALGGFILSLGPELLAFGRDLGPGPYGLLWRFAPGFGNVRYPERFSLLLLLGLAPLVAFGLARLRSRLGASAAGGLVLLIFLEHLSLPRELSPLPVDGQIADVYRWLASRQDIHVVAEVPASRCFMERADALPMYLSTVHWKRTVQGYTSYFPPSYNFIKWRLYHLPAPQSLRFLDRFGVDAVVIAPQNGAPPEWVRRVEAGRLEGPFASGYSVLRLPQARLEPPAPASDAGFRELDRRGWDIAASTPGARRAVDGRSETAWTTEWAAEGKDFFRVQFKQPARVARVAMEVGPSGEFPVRLKLSGLAAGGWTPLEFDAEAAYDQLFASLLAEPRRARMLLELAGEPVRGLNLEIAGADGYGMPWTISELRVYERASGAP